MANVTAIGGAQMGWVSATWPFARLTASPEELSVSIGGIASYRFSPDQVVALERHGSIPIISSGVKIVHTVGEYPERIVFWYLGNPNKLIGRIAAAGFRPAASAAQVHKRDGVPWRWSFVLAAIIIWNALMFLDMDRKSGAAGPWSLVALGLLFATTIALPISDRLRAIVLKPGRSYTEIQPFVGLIRLIGGAMLVGFAFQYALG